MIQYLIPLTQDTFDNVRVGVLCAGLRAVADRCGGGEGVHPRVVLIANLLPRPPPAAPQ